MRPLALIAAVAKNGVIGREGKLPWHYSEDLKYFKAKTLHHALIMGRKTFESFPAPLPHRVSVVVTKNVTEKTSSPFAKNEESPVVFASSFHQALELAYEQDPCPFVIGGALVYGQALSLATELYLTELEDAFEGDTFFPPLNKELFKEVSRVRSEKHPLHYVHYARI